MEMTIRIIHPIRFALLLCLPLLVVPLKAMANPAEDLYAAEAPVAGEDAISRSEGIAAALSQVLVRLTGKRAINAQPGVEELLGRASQFVQQYRYRLADTLELAAEPAQPPATEPAPQQQRYIWVKFDKPALDRELRRLGFPVWSGVRPRVLVWLASDNGRHRRLFNPEAVPGSRQAMLERAGERGLPLRLPLLDLEDRNRLAVSDLWSLYEEGIRQASARYGQVVILVGRLRQLGPGQWRADWNLFDDLQGESFQTRGDLLALLADGMDQTMDRLAARYAPAKGDGGPQKVVLRVSNLPDLEAYAGLMRTLSDMDGVESLVLRHLEGADLWLELLVLNGADGLERTLLANPLLQRELPSEPAPLVLPQPQSVSVQPVEPELPGADLHFRWL